MSKTCLKVLLSILFLFAFSSVIHATTRNEIEKLGKNIRGLQKADTPATPTAVLRNSKVTYEIIKNWTQKNDQGEAEEQHETVCQGDAVAPVTLFPDFFAASPEAVDKPTVTCASKVRAGGTESKPIQVTLVFPLWLLPSIEGSEPRKIFQARMGFLNSDGVSQARDAVYDFVTTNQMNLKNLSFSIHSGGDENFDVNLTIQDDGASDADAQIKP
ncbi:MAG: hypothetical protein JWQ35_340 [Bacteriovoracaceae bacterium]|nr:hypothetical protein [Bacteriovoracaceae bacterium]